MAMAIWLLYPRGQGLQHAFIPARHKYLADWSLCGHVMRKNCLPGDQWGFCCRSCERFMAANNVTCEED